MAIQTIAAKQGETVDLAIWRAASLGATDIGTVLTLNPGLGDAGDTLAAGTPIILPAITQATTPTRDLVQLWD